MVTKIFFHAYFYWHTETQQGAISRKSNEIHLFRAALLVLIRAALFFGGGRIIATARVAIVRIIGRLSNEARRTAETPRTRTLKHAVEASTMVPIAVI